MLEVKKFGAAAGWAATMLLAANMAWGAAAPAPSSTPAPSKPLEVTGKIRAVDVVNQVIKLENGQFFLVPSSINLSDLKAGDQIILSGDKDQYGSLQVKTVSKAK